MSGLGVSSGPEWVVLCPACKERLPRHLDGCRYASIRSWCDECGEPDRGLILNNGRVPHLEKCSRHPRQVSQRAQQLVDHQDRPKTLGEWLTVIEGLPTANDRDFLMCVTCRQRGGRHLADCSESRPRHSLGCRCDECRALMPKQIAQQSKPRIRLREDGFWVCSRPGHLICGYAHDGRPSSHLMAPINAAKAAYADWARQERASTPKTLAETF